MPKLPKVEASNRSKSSDGSGSVYEESSSDSEILSKHAKRQKQARKKAKKKKSKSRDRKKERSSGKHKKSKKHKKSERRRKLSDSSDEDDNSSDDRRSSRRRAVKVKLALIRAFQSLPSSLNNLNELFNYKPPNFKHIILVLLFLEILSVYRFFLINIHLLSDLNRLF